MPTLRETCGGPGIPPGSSPHWGRSSKYLSSWRSWCWRRRRSCGRASAAHGARSQERSACSFPSAVQRDIESSVIHPLSPWQKCFMFYYIQSFNGEANSEEGTSKVVNKKRIFCAFPFFQWLLPSFAPLSAFLIVCALNSFACARKKKTKKVPPSGDQSASA